MKGEVHRSSDRGVLGLLGVYEGKIVRVWSVKDVGDAFLWRDSSDKRELYTLYDSSIRDNKHLGGFGFVN